MEELEWKDIKGENLSKYEISPAGVRTKKTGYIHKLVERGEYYCVKLLDDNNNRKYYLFHVLLAKTFIPNPNPNKLLYVNHKDEDKLNNDLDNLEWCDNRYNLKYGTCQERRLKTCKEYGACNAEIPVVCIRNGKQVGTYKSISEAARQLDLNVGNIAACVRGKRKTCGGYNWEAAEPLNK